MSTTATINLSGSVSQMGSNSHQQNQDLLFQDGGVQEQSMKHGQAFHVAGTQPGQVTYAEEPVTQVSAPGPKLAFSASNYPPNVQQQQYQQQFQMESQYQIQQQNQMQQQHQTQTQHGQQQPQPIYNQQQHQPYEQYTQPQELSYQPIQMMTVQPQLSVQNKEFTKPPVFEAPIAKMQIVKKNQSMPTKAHTQEVQQAVRPSRSESISGFDEITEPPHFIKHPEPSHYILEGEPVSMTARVTPASDSNLSVQWYKDGQPLSAGSRFNTSFERGFAVLEILYTIKDDSGEYSCVAKNDFGMDQTTPSLMNVTLDDNVALNSHLPQEMADNIASMEANLNNSREQVDHYEIPLQQPKFIRAMPGQLNLFENQSVHLETIFVPINDSALVIEWYKNGKPLNNGCRFNMISDRGFAILDIIGLTPDDAGEYYCLASNSVGSAQSTVVRLIVTADVSVVTTSQLPKESIQHLQALDSCLLDDIARPDFRYEEIEEADSPPNFDIEPIDQVVEEGNPAKFLVKVSGYPRPRISWYLNESFAVSTSAQRIYQDGSISYFEFHKCRQNGLFNIQVVAKNKHGDASANATLTVMPTDDFRPELKRIDPENPFRKLTSLKKVDVSPELRNAFTKQKPMLIELNNVEKESIVRGKQNRSVESSTAENLYNDVQSKLKRSDRLSYAGAPNTNVPQPHVPTNDYSSALQTNDITVPSNQPLILSTQMTFTFGKTNSG